MKQRIITGLVLILIAVPPLIFGGTLLNILIGLIVGIGSSEIVRIFKADWPKYSQVLFPIVSLLMSFIAMYLPNLLLPVFVLFFLLCITLVVVDEHYQIAEMSVVVFFHLILLFVLLCYQLLLEYNISHFFIIYIVVVSCLTDIGAYFTGYFFGKHKLNERISPKKTIEGSVGGCVLGTLCGALFAYFFLEGMSMPSILVLSFCMTIVGQIGDLIFSAIKRHYGIKDYGNLLPGHGGVLDRTDSILINVVFAYAFLLVVLL